MLDILGFELLSDIAPGESVLVTLDGQLHRHTSPEARAHPPVPVRIRLLCPRPDSLIDDLSVYKVRLRMGEARPKRSCASGRITISNGGVRPATRYQSNAWPAAAHMLGVKYREGLIKNRYIPAELSSCPASGAGAIRAAQSSEYHCRWNFKNRT